ncbi:MAG: rhomboid family intramembrane serine protease [Bacteroidales bacterium]|jgi:membrane associated rhomboid family serine protease|nr:rhomboid family intramembrane serine protease [Bacteroidales bacterium]
MNNIRLSDIPPVVRNLIIINALMLLVTWVLENAFGIDLGQILGLHYFKSEMFHPYQYVTHIFMHGGLMHLFFNMFALWMFGRILETVWGSKKFFIYFIVTGLGAAALHTFVIHLQMTSIINDINAFSNTPSPEGFAILIKKSFTEINPQHYREFLSSWYSNPDNPNYIGAAKELLNKYLDFKMNIPTVGASGAVFGVLLAFGMLFPNTQLMLLFPPIPIKAKYFVIGYGVLELWLGLTRPGSNIAHFAHLGGMLFGFILLKYWKSKRSDFY